MIRENFVFYRSFFEAIMCLPDREQLEAFRALCNYGFNGEIADLSPVVRAIFALAKPQLDANNRRYENGCKGGAPNGNNNAKKTTKNNQKQPKNNQKQPKNNQKQPKNNQKQPNDNVNDNVNVNDNDSSSSSNSITEQVNNNNNYHSTILQEKEKKIEKKEKEKTADETQKTALVKSANKTKADKEARARKFYDRLLDYLPKYGAPMLREFYDYWTESNEQGALMRFEMERVFDISRRLATWASRAKQKNNGGNYGTNNYKTATERLRDEYNECIEGVLAKYRK